MKATSAVLESAREFLGNRFVYALVSARAHGLALGVNMNPDQACNFDCVYCEVVRRESRPRVRLTADQVAEELRRTLALVQAGELTAREPFRSLPPELLRLKQVNLSGEGEPTLCPDFCEIAQAVVHVRARSGLPFFKIVLFTNATALDRPAVQAGLRCFTAQDEIWAKLDVGTAAEFERVNRPGVRFEQVLANILTLARQRPVVIQSMFPLFRDHEPNATELHEYCLRLRELVADGAQLARVQVYSATRPARRSDCSHLSLRGLSQIARTVHEETGLSVEVF